MKAQTLTHDEARRRAQLLAVRQYDIDVDLTDLPEGPAVRCTSVVTFDCREPGVSTFADCAADVIDATLNDVPLPPPVDGRLHLPQLAGENTLRVRSVQSETATGEGVHKATDPADGEIYLWMSFKPDEARHVWACFDQPDLKAPHAFTVTAPRGWTVLSNSGVPDVADHGAERRWTFPATPPLSTYNAVINAGPFAELHRQTGEHDLGIYSRRSLHAVLERDADEIFTVTEQGLAFFGRVFGMPFPQRVYNQVFVPEMGGAMENFGCVTWSDAYLRRVSPTPAEAEAMAKTLLHEMAHMWFGNIVTMRWWDDLWLNEAFAEFACNWAAVRATKYTDAWAAHLALDKPRAYLADQGPSSHPIRQPVRDVEQAASIFDSITYPKGASVLQQLMTYVGEDTFAAGMTAYFAKHQWGNTALQDLIDSLAAASGRDLDTWRAAWLETAGTDRLMLEREGERSVLVTRAPSGAPRPHVLAVGAYARDGDRLHRSALVRVDAHGERTPVDLPAGADLYLVNDDDLTFATTRAEPGARDVLIDAAAQLPTAISRGVAIGTVWDMLIAGEATAAEVVRCLSRVLAVETSASTIEPYLMRACDAAELWAPDGERDRLLGEVAAAGRLLVGEPGSRQCALRSLARAAGTLDEIAWLQDAAGDDVDLHWRALTRKAELGGATDDEAAQLLRHDPDPDAWVRTLAVRAAARNAASKDEVWAAVAVDRKVPISEVGKVMTAFWRPGQDDVLTPFASRYLDAVPALDRGGMIPGMMYTRRLFPVFGIDEAFLRRAEQVAQSAAPLVAKYAIERADEVRRMLRARRSGSVTGL